MSGPLSDALIAAPLLLPAIMAAVTLLFRKRRRMVGAALSLAGVLVLVAVGIALLGRAEAGAVQAYALGDWPAPFGIVLVLDRLAALLLVLTSLLAFIVLGHAILTGLDRRGWHFHPLFQFQLLGLNGAFLTGDIFNLFVFFEVMLIASYGLMLHGQGKERLQAGLQYVVVNLVGSTLFLFGIGILYGVTGTLNLADMARRVDLLPPADRGLLMAGTWLVMAVFALKAALLPLHLWLPRTYAATAPAVAALFAVMTKVGAYAIIRMATVVFGAGAGGWSPGSLMLPAALGTVAVGFIGMVAARNLGALAAFGAIGSTGTLLTAIALFDQAALAAAVYYLVHTTLAAALLFLVVDLVTRARGGGQIAAGRGFSRRGWLGACFMLAAIALAGLPPLPGFIGKLLILRAAWHAPGAGWIWAVLLLTTLLALIALSRAGSAIFWKDDAAARPATRTSALSAAVFVPAAALLAMLAGLSVLAGPALEFAGATASQLLSRQTYIDAVLPPAGGGI